jgi:hypothetical protein
VSLVSINVWRLAGDSLNITCNFLCCNHQVHRDFLITLYMFYFINIYIIITAICFDTFVSFSGSSKVVLSYR